MDSVKSLKIWLILRKNWNGNAACDIWRPSNICKFAFHQFSVNNVRLAAIYFALSTLNSVCENKFWLVILVTSHPDVTKRHDNSLKFILSLKKKTEKS